MDMDMNMNARVFSFARRVLKTTETLATFSFRCTAVFGRIATGRCIVYRCIGN